LVSWWFGTTLSSAPHQPTREVDQTEWLPVAAAGERLTYADERAVLAEANALPETTPLIILRHAKAALRQGWKADDNLRPLVARGQDQLPYIGQLLGAYTAERLISSPATRCVETLQTYAQHEGLDVTTEPSLTEDRADPVALATYMTALARQTGHSSIPTVICGHRPVIPHLLTPLGVSPRPLTTAACVVLHLDHDGQPVRTEWHDTLRVKAG